MKRFFLFLLLLALVTSAAGASSVDLSGMTFDELVALREQLNLAIWNSAEWQEVTVPQGIWDVGKDIPAGHGSIRVAAKREFVKVSCFAKLDQYGMNPDYSDYIITLEMCSEGYNPFKDTSMPTTVDFKLQDGLFFKCSGDVIFTPFTGKPDLGFK